MPIIHCAFRLHNHATIIHLIPVGLKFATVLLTSIVWKLIHQVLSDLFGFPEAWVIPFVSNLSHCEVFLLHS